MTSLVQRRNYLEDQRRGILARAVLGAIAGVVPLPFLDDWAVEKVLGSGYLAIARAHGVDLSPEAVTNLVHGKTKPLPLVETAASGIAYRIAGRAAKRVLFAYAMATRVRSVARSFVAMTLFDHYCAKLHTGAALDGETALALRVEIARTIERTPGALVLHPFRRAALGAARATLRAPLELADIASGGGLRRMLAKRSAGEITEGEAVDEMDQQIDAALANKDGFVARTVAALEAQVTAEANPYLDAAIESLDTRWRARIAAGTTKSTEP